MEGGDYHVTLIQRCRLRLMAACLLQFAPSQKLTFCLCGAYDHHIHILRRSSHFDPNFNYDIDNECPDQL